MQAGLGRIGRDVVACSGSNCSDNGECLFRFNVYSCNCFEGYSGLTCETKLNLTGSAYSPQECGPEYTGVVCEIPLKCLECSENEICVWNNVTKSYFCDCMAGYSGEDCDVVATTSSRTVYATHSTDMLTTTLWMTTTDIVSGVAGIVMAPLVLVVVLTFVTTALTFWKIQKKKCKLLQ